MSIMEASPPAKRARRVTMDGSHPFNSHAQQTKTRKRKKVGWSKEVRLLERIVTALALFVRIAHQLRFVQIILLTLDRRTSCCESTFKPLPPRILPNPSGLPLPRPLALVQESSVASVGTNICVLVSSRETGRLKKTLSLRNSKAFMATSTCLESIVESSLSCRPCRIHLSVFEFLHCIGGARLQRACRIVQTTTSRTVGIPRRSRK